MLLFILKILFYHFQGANGKIVSSHLFYVFPFVGLKNKWVTPKILYIPHYQYINIY